MPEGEVAFLAPSAGIAEEGQTLSSPQHLS